MDYTQKYFVKHILLFYLSSALELVGERGSTRPRASHDGAVALLALAQCFINGKNRNQSFAL